MEPKTHTIHGLAASSPLYFIAEHFDSALVVFPTRVDLSRARETLSYFKPDAQVLAFPAFERFFEPLKQEPGILYDRLRTQNELIDRQSKQVFVLTNLPALSHRTLSKRRFSTSRLTLKKSDWMSRDKLIMDLSSLGYRRDDLAEDPGFYSVRGFLLDVFLPYRTHPVRIEFFGDEIISIRSFEASSQRSLEELNELIIPPVRELITTSERWSKAKERIKDYGDSRGVGFDEREKLFFDLENNRDVLEPRWLLPAFEEQLETLFDYLPNKIPLVWVDPEEAREDFERAQRDDARSFESLNKLAFPLEQTIDPLSDLLNKSGSELRSLVSAKGLGYQVEGLETLRDRLVKSKSFGPLESLCLDLADKGIKTDLIINSPKRREALLESLEKARSHIRFHDGPPFDGFVSTTFQRAFITERDIFGVKRKHSGSAQKTKEDFLRQFSDLVDGDYVIHEDHGIARYHGLQQLEINGGKTEFLVLEYADNDRLYLPVYRLDKLSRYVSDEYGSPRLDRLGSTAFAKRKSKIREDILRIAHELLQIAAERRLSRVERQKYDEAKLRAFGDAFAYDLTGDQEQAVQEIQEDLNKNHPMDRLICGDVGFGKTEVAMRAAMIALLRGQQVALLAPTTVLVEQHYRGLQRRFKDFNFKIERLSRFVSAADQKKIADRLKKGEVDLVVGTHRLLGSDIEMNRLGLLIVDEEQKFGVKHKERLKKMRAQVDILTLSATPIPRTLQLSVSGIRELSLITTPPENRESVRTFVAGFEESLIRSAIERELARGGQVLFVHNRVQTIDALSQKLRAWMPKLRFVVAHGQMKETDLEQRMIEFIEGKAELLLATSIIENGIDIPTANTILIDHPELFGLSNLYQLRGRVGRSFQTAYAYFLVHEETRLTPEASKRLQVIQTYTELGSGFNVATHDMEIRGSGNILGEEQSGVIAEVGLELYTQMLQETLREIQNQKPTAPLPELNTGYTAFIPESYIPDASIRILTYRQLNRVRSPAELGELEEELLDRFGFYPPELENFSQLIKIRTLTVPLKAQAIDLFPGRMTIQLGPDTPLEPKKLLPLLGKELSIDPKGRLSYVFESAIKKPQEATSSKGKPPEFEDFERCRALIKKLCDLAQVSVENV